MKVQTGNSSAEDGFEAGKKAAKQAEEGGEKIVYVFGSSKYDLQQVLDGVNEVFDNVPITGCSSTAEINNEQITEGGVAIGTISGSEVDIGIGLGKGLDENDKEAGKSAVEKAFKNLESDEIIPYSKGSLSEWAEHREVFVNTFADPTKGNAENILEGVNSFLGPGFSSTGEFSSDEYDFQDTVIFHEGEVKQNAVTCIIVNTGKSVGSDRAHGFQPTPNDFDVTEVENDVVQELSGKTPKEVYSQVFGEDQADNPEFLLMAPFGMKNEREDTHRLRVAIDVQENGCYKCLPPPERNENVNLMMGEKSSMLEAATEAAKKAKKKTGLEKEDIEAAIIFSCAARYAIYDDKETANREVENVRKALGEDTKLFGLYGYGQIATSEGWTALNNDTIVVQTLGRK